MKKSTLTRYFTALLMIAYASLQALGQSTQDTNKLHDPMIIQPGFAVPQSDNVEATVITIDDYDNFKLGVDFAECSVTTNPQNPTQFYAVWNAAGSAGGKGYRTTNGFDWTPSNPSWTGMWGDVVVTSDSAGNLAYQNMYGSSSIQGAKVAVSNDFGGTWGSAVNSISGYDKNWMAADQSAGSYTNYLYGTMTSSSGGNHVRSTNNGGSWTNTYSFPTQSLPGMMVAVGPKNGVSGGAVYVVTNSGSSFASTYTFYESNDGGATFQYKSGQNFSNYVGSNVNGRNSVQNMRTRPYPFIAADNSYGPHRGRLYLVYASNAPAGNGNKPDIFCRYSDDAGTTWSSATTVNDDPNSQNNHNWFPAVWCDKTTGRLYVSWMDTRDTPTSDSAMMYASYSTDGVNWQPNQKISNKKMKINCTTCGGGGSPMYLGDYNGIGSNKITSLLAWTDFRDNNFGSYVSYFPDFAMRMEPALDTLAPMAEFLMMVPSVKLFTDTVKVTATVSSNPTAFNITYPQGNQLWNFPGEVPINVSLINSVPEGDYTLNIVATGMNGTPVHKRTATVRVVAATAPVANFYASDSTVCTGQGVNFYDLSSGPATQWMWSFPGGTPSSSTQQNPTNIVYTEAGTYDVTLQATNQVGSNTVTKTGFITAETTPVAPTAQGQAICTGNPVPDLTAEGNNITWYYNGEVVGTGNTYSTGQTEPGTYTYQVTARSGNCESQPVNVTLTINALPVVSFNQLLDICENAAPYTLIEGLPGGGTYSGPGVTDGTTFNPALAGVGTHTLTYTYADENSCSNAATQTITVVALPALSFNPVAPVCAGSAPVTLTALPEGGSFSGTGVSGNTFDPVAAGVGSFDLTYSYTDPVTYCSNTAVQQAVVNALPVVNVADSTICGLYQIMLDATVPNGQSYLWSPGGQTTAVIQVDTTGYGLGQQLLTVTVNDFNNCATTDTVKVTFFDCTGIEESDRSLALELYPNPNAGVFTLRSNKLPNGAYMLRVFNSINTMVYKQDRVIIDGTLQYPVDLQHLPSGMYLLRLDSHTYGWTKQFIISK